MKLIRQTAVFTAALILTGHHLLAAGTCHVWKNSPTPAVPYDAWTNAARDVQSAVNYAQANIASFDTVLVTNGTYAVTNAQILINQPLTLRSVEGAEKTSIYRGATCLNRVFYINHASAVLDGLTVSNGWARGNTGSQNGGGIYLQNGVVRNSRILLNTADRSGANPQNNQSGGGLYLVAGLVERCVIAGNQVLGEAVYGGGVVVNGAGTLRHCIITNNVISSSSGSGRAGSGVRITNGSALVHDCLIAGNRHTLGNNTLNEGAGVTISSGTLRNCTVTANTAVNQPTAGIFRSGGSVINCVIFGNTTDLASGLNPQVNTTTGFTYSCAPELTAGTGNTILDPSFLNPAGGNYRLAAASPCLNAGSNTGVSSTDLDGNARIAQTTVDMGAYEKDTAIGAIECDFAAPVRAGFDSLDVDFTARVAGAPVNTDITWYGWSFGDSQTASGADQDEATHTYGYGTFTVILTVSNSLGVATTRTREAYIAVYPSTIHVSAAGGNVAPYASWAAAASSIPSAVNAAGIVNGVGSMILVSNGAYGVTSELFLQKGITLRAVNGPTRTAIYRVGAQATGQPQHRVLRIGSPTAIVDGFSITNGYGTTFQGQGVYLHGGTLTNCHVRLNRVPSKTSPNNMQGAGVYMAGGLVTHCLIADNWLWHEQARGSGATVAGGTLRNSVVRNNLLRGDSYEYGSGISVENSAAIVENCLVVSNVVVGAKTSTEGSAIYINNGTVRNTTVTANLSTNHIVSGIYRSSNGSMINCIVSGNVSVRGDSQQAQVGGSSALPTGFTYTCAPELASGTGNLAVPPQLKPDYTLDPVSPCIDAGLTEAWMTGRTDLAGNDRVIGATDRVDLGCYEFDPLAGVFECSFAADRTAAFDALAPVFTAAATGPNTNLVYYWWSFGNGNLSQGPARGTITNTYATLGNFNVTLTVSNAIGQTATAVRPGYIQVHPSTMYVAPSGSHTAPFASWGDAATNIQSAVDASWSDGVSGTLVRVAAGNYPVSATLTIPLGITVRSENGPLATTIYRTTSAAQNSVVRLGALDAALDGFTITNGLSTSSAVWGAGVNIAAGTLRNCRVMFNRTTGGDSRRGGGIYQASGLVEDCLIASNSMDVGQSISGGGVHTDGGILRRCVVRGNTLKGWPNGTGVNAEGTAVIENSLIVDNESLTGSSQYDGGAGLRVNSANAVVRNATVTGNKGTAIAATGGVKRDSGTVINAIAFGNTVADVADNVNTTTGFTYSCAPELASGTGNQTGDPLFRNVAAGDYRLSTGSPAIDTGLYQSWMEGAIDLAGKPRVKGGATAVDMGAYEWQLPPGTVVFLR